MTTPTQDYRRTSHSAPPELLKGLDARVSDLIGFYQRRSGIVDELRSDAEAVDAQSAKFKDLTDHLLREQVRDCQNRFRRRGKIQKEVLTHSLAAIREVAHRQTGLRPFIVQLMGALALNRGYLAEMATGEGKTLTAGLAAVLGAWTGRPCHVITVNDYLVQRDAERLRNLYGFCGLKPGSVTGPMSPDERRAGYACDITYVTSKEVLADFLRDRLRLGELHDPGRRLIRTMLTPRNRVEAGLVMRGLHTAIVDEADSVLIDEAVTPLIISTPRKNEVLRDVVTMAKQIVEPLQEGTDYRIDQRYREIELTKTGLDHLESRCASLSGIWKGNERRQELIRQALLAREFYQPGKQYVINDGQIVIVDEFTGRPMPQRSWRQGMHQAIEAKEGVQITDPAETLARLSFQRYFRLYTVLSGMSGTAKEAAGEFWQIYKLPVVRIPTNKPCIRVQWPDRVFASETQKWEAIAEEVERLHRTGRPILIGTRSVAASEHLAGLLEQRGLQFSLLNAVRHQEEAVIIFNAGLAGRITIATNMAGRGTDISLGDGVAGAGGLHVLATERHESGRVDRQLFGRSGRQGDPGSAQAFVSVEDELIKRNLPKALQRNLQGLVKRQLPGCQKAAEAALGMAQRRAQRLAVQQRKSVLRLDDWMEEALSFAGPHAT